jgi:hypothetical protein
MNDIVNFTERDKDVKFPYSFLERIRMNLNEAILKHRAFKIRGRYISSYTAELVSGDSPYIVIVSDDDEGAVIKINVEPPISKFQI